MRGAAMVVPVSLSKARARIAVNEQNPTWDIRKWAISVGGWKLYNKTDALLKVVSTQEQCSTHHVDQQWCFETRNTCQWLQPANAIC